MICEKNRSSVSRVFRVYSRKRTPYVVTGTRSGSSPNSSTKRICVCVCVRARVCTPDSYLHARQIPAPCTTRTCECIKIHTQTCKDSVPCKAAQ